MTRYAAITGWGHHVPERVLTNDELAKLVDTSDEWVRTRTGIRERRVVAPGEATASMCVAASRRALAKAKLDPAALDLVICGTTTPDRLLPATACLVQKQLGAARAAAFDVNAACTGFLAAIAAGSQFIRGGACERVLVVGGETLSRFTNWKDRNTCILFGDGAGAVVLEAAEEECGVLAPVLGSDGDVDGMLTVPAGGAEKPSSAETVAAAEHFILMRGQDVFKHAVRSMTRVAGESLKRAGLTPADLRMVIPHQANLRIIEAVREYLHLPADRMFVNVDRYGNTAAASVPIALSEYASSTRLEPGDNLLLTAFGGGLTWGAAVVRWAHIPAVTGRLGAGNSGEAADAPLSQPIDRALASK